jgi:hypothetical protein
MKEVICQFCQRKCRPDMIKSGGAFWRCDYHGGVVVKYYYPLTTDETWSTLVMVYNTDEATYHANFFYDNPKITYKFRVDRVKKGWRGILESTEIFTLDFHPEITPDNLPNKITKYIIFS